MLSYDSRIKSSETRSHQQNVLFGIEKRNQGVTISHTSLSKLTSHHNVIPTEGQSSFLCDRAFKERCRVKGHCDITLLFTREQKLDRSLLHCPASLMQQKCLMLYKEHTCVSSEYRSDKFTQICGRTMSLKLHIRA